MIGILSLFLLNLHLPKEDFSSVVVPVAYLGYEKKGVYIDIIRILCMFICISARYKYAWYAMYVHYVCYMSCCCSYLARFSGCFFVNFK